MFKTLFGPSRKELWAQLAQELDAQISESTFFTDSEVTLKVNDWQIVLDTYTVNSNNSSQTYTRMRAPFWNPQGVRFSIKKANFITGPFTRFLKLQDIEVGHPFFDHRYIVKGSPESTIQKVFENKDLCAACMDIKPGHISIRDSPPTWNSKSSYPPGVDLLQYEVGGLIKDVHVLKRLFTVFRIALTELYAVNHPTEPALEPQDTPLLSALKRTLESELGWFTPVVERRGDGIQAPVSITMGPSFSGMVSVSPPFFPELEVSLSLQAHIPNATLPLEMRTLQGITDRALNVTDDNIGHPLVDKMFIIRGRARAYHSLAPHLEALLSIAATPHITLDIEGNFLHLSALNISCGDVPRALALFEKIWKESANIALHTEEKSLPPYEG